MKELTTKEAVEHYLLAKEYVLSPRTVRTYRESLKSFVAFFGEDTAVSSLTVHDLRRYRAYHASRGIAQYTAAKYLRELVTLLHWLEAEGLILGNPARRLGRMRLDDIEAKVASPADMEKAIRFINGRLADGTEPPANLCRSKAIIYFLADTGCRAGGIVGMTLDRLDLEAGTAVVIEKGRGGAKKRTVFISGQTVAAIKDWLKFRPVDCDHNYLLAAVSPPHHRGRKMNYQVLGYTLARLKAAAEISGNFNPHSFRHAAARNWLLNGADLATVSQLLGHSGLDVTAQFYATWATSQLQKQHGRFSVVGNNLAGVG